MMQRPFILLAFLLSSIPAFAQERTIGLLSLPEVFGPGVCASFEPEEISLYAAPEDGKPIAVIRNDKNWSFAPHGGCEGLEVGVHFGKERQDLPQREFDYEMSGAIVVEQRAGWLKIRLHDRSAWLKPSVVDRFMPLADLYEEFVGVTHIKDEFSGRLTASPGALKGPIMPAVKPQQPVRVLQIRDQFVQVEVLSNSACSAADDGPPEVIATGWLPLHDQKGEPTVWFSSRGC